MKVEKKIQHRESKLRILVPIMIFIIGAGIFLYPAISNYWVSQRQKEIREQYSHVIQNESKEDVAHLFEEAKIYNDNLAGDPLHDPFVEGSGYVIPDNYEEVLNLNGDGVMGMIRIPKIDVNLPIYHGTSEEVLSQGAGHIEATSLPIGGINRHSVISAHRGLPSALLFTRLDELDKGDLFFIDVLGETLAYMVDQIEVIEPEELEYLARDSKKDLVTLLTCTPYGVNTHRLLVRGCRTEYTEEMKKSEQETSHISYWLKEYIVSILFGVILILLILIGVVLNKKRKVQK